MYTDIHTHQHPPTHTRTHTCRSLNNFKPLRRIASMRARDSLCAKFRANPYIRICMCVYIYIQAHIHTHMNIHIYVCVRAKFRANPY